MPKSADSFGTNTRKVAFIFKEEALLPSVSGKLYFEAR